MGSGTFGLPVLEAIAASGHNLAAVVTAPDKPQGRGKIMTASPIKVWAEAKGVAVLTPLKLNAPESVAALKTVGADVFVVASYGALLSTEVLALPPRGCINVHPSLLPKYRGASPVVQALLDGEKQTGMTIMMMAAALDAGDILLQEAAAVDPEENARELTDRLAKLGGRMTVRTLDLIESGRSTRILQDHSKATYCSKLKKEDARLDWSWSAQKIHDRVRGLAIWPGTVVQWKGKGLKILSALLATAGTSATPEADPSDAGRPGEVVEVSSERGIRVKTGAGSLWVLEVQPEGSRPMNHRDFVNGHAIKPGSVFD